MELKHELEDNRKGDSHSSSLFSNKQKQNVHNKYSWIFQIPTQLKFSISRWKHENSKKTFGNFAWMSFLHRGGERGNAASPQTYYYIGFYFQHLFVVQQTKKASLNHVSSLSDFDDFCSWSAFTLTFLWSPQKLEVGFSKQKLCKKHKKEMLAKDLYLCLIKMF